MDVRYAIVLRLLAALEECADDLDDHEDDCVVHHVHLVGVDSGEHHEQEHRLCQYGYDLPAEAGQILALEQAMMG